MKPSLDRSWPEWHYELMYCCRECRVVYYPDRDGLGQRCRRCWPKNNPINVGEFRWIAGEVRRVQPVWWQPWTWFAYERNVGHWVQPTGQLRYAHIDTRR